MGSQDMAAFTKKMFSEKVFSCSICSSLLKVPVMLVENVGNMCKNCFENGNEKNDWNAIPNPKLDVILKTLQLPCKYETEGCDITTHYDHLKEHEVECVFRPINCLLSKDDCQWKGRLMDLFQHFKEEHPKHVLNSPYEEFSLELNIAKSANVVKMLNNKNRQYVLTIRQLETEKMFLYFIQSLKSSQEETEMVIKYVGTNDEYKFRLRCFPFSEKIGLDNCKKIPSSAVQEISDSSDNVKVVIKPKRCEVKNITSELLKYLECPVCKELMRPPIQQCITGHSVCEICRKQLTQCPTCRQAWGDYNIRNFSLEGLTPSVQYPCVYSPFGCTANFFGYDINEHEAICNYKVYTCPMSDCRFSGNYASCKSHFQLTHAGDFVDGTIYHTNFTPLANRASSTTHVKFFFQHKNIYRLTFQRLADSCSWYIQILNNYDENIKYFYTISIINPLMEQRKMTQSNLCINQDVTVTDSMMIRYSYDSLASYKSGSSSDQINYCCEIIDKR